ncbi:MAG: outer membrane lipoprotein-sorting protein [Candidatus Marinimicrobia bacterium]|nr:outer membrane lipoprotein-sorting protein [Candidatus Neomarinimicrobiota bacterium]MDD9931179.1 outer membrane lipoprotein-sorting protein [Candidatus Neomarinimicrobiota bacterium]
MILLTSLMSSAWGQTGIEIAKMVDEKPTPRDMVNTTNMVLTNSKGKTRTNVMMSRSIDGNKKQIIWFLEPKDDRGVAFLKIEHNNKDDEMRMWLPAFKKVRRISSKRKGDAFMGSDLSYEDLTSRDLNEYTYKRLDDELVNSTQCFVLESKPNTSAKSSYSKHISWIDKENLNIVQEYSFDKRGALKKEKYFQHNKLKDYYVMNQIRVKDVQKQHTTEVTFESLEVDTGINPALFQEKNLKRIPKN